MVSVIIIITLIVIIITLIIIISIVVVVVVIIIIITIIIIASMAGDLLWRHNSRHVARTDDDVTHAARLIRGVILQQGRH